MKHLYLVRHAKSSWKYPELDDIDRPLNKRGLRTAPEMAEHLKERYIGIESIISSPAQRAMMTAKIFAQVIDFDIQKIVYLEQLYFSGVTAMLEQINDTDSAVESLMLIGHNPNMTSLLNQLCGFQTYNMPTCAIAEIQFHQQWAEVNKNSGHLANYDYPKKPR